MFIKITTSGPRKYVKIVESFRNEAGKPRQRVLATLGRLEHSREGAADAVINGLLKASNKADMREGTGDVEFASALSVGDVWLLNELWQSLGFTKVLRGILNGRRQYDVEQVLRVMVFNRLCNPESKLGVLRWLETTRIPQIPTDQVTHQRLLRGMDTLMDCSDALDEALSGLLRPLIDQELSIVFYDLTTITTEGKTEHADEIRKYGLSKDGGIARQVMLGVVQTAEGLPIYHEVFEGNTAETKTLLPTIQKVLRRYPVKRVVLVADRGLLSLDNLEALEVIDIEGQPLEFILAVPARRYHEFDEILTQFEQEKSSGNSDQDSEVITEFPWNNRRLIIAHRPDTAREQGMKRDQQIAELEAEAARLVSKLDSQDEGKRYRGKKLSDGGVMARFYKAVTAAHLSRIIKVDLKSKTFTYDIDQVALERARRADGKLILVTNLPDHTSTEIVSRYKSLADIERGFRVLKSEIEIAPVFHRKPERIKAHALICFIALILYRVLRMRLKAGDSPYSPDRLLEIMKKIQYHQVRLHRKQTASGLSVMTPEQKDLFEVVGLPIPSKTRL